jgi:isoleucyl-tRNA synthetase
LGYKRPLIFEDYPAMTELKDTLNLPQTDYPMRASLSTMEPARLALWQQEGMYQKMRAARQGATPFILHCGPPYANGQLHAGHLVPSLLKDIVVRSKFMAGYDTPFVPGWDCHGLPLEWKVETELREKRRRQA